MPIKQYDFVTPFTSLVVVKPNNTATQTDLRPADAYGILNILSTDAVARLANPLCNIYNDVSLVNNSVCLSAFSDVPLVQSFGGASLKRPSSFAVRPVMMPLALSTKKSSSIPRTTTRSPLFTSTTVATTEIVAEAATAAVQGESVSFSPKEWINQFEHNETHVKILFGNSTRELLWQDEKVNLKTKITFTMVLIITRSYLSRSNRLSNSFGARLLPTTLFAGQFGSAPITCEAYLLITISRK